MDQEGYKVFTDAQAVELLLGIISFLITAALGLLAYIWNRREKQYERQYLEDKAYRDVITTKFEGINGFITDQKVINTSVEKDIEFIKLNKIPPINPNPAHA